MLGAIIGDICGSPYEINNCCKTEDIELFGQNSHPTDDSYMTIAVANALIDTDRYQQKYIKDALIDSMHYYGNIFFLAGYGSRFKTWLQNREREPYNSFGNGSAMRVSSVGWLYDSLGLTIQRAAITAEVTHNHPEGIKGAEAVAACIYLARTGASKEEIREYVENNFYSLDFTLDEIRDEYIFDVSCEGSVPQAIEAFLEGDSFEDVIRKAISIGGDSDTIAAMAGGIAEAYYGIPRWMVDKTLEILRYGWNVEKPQNYSILEYDLLKFWDYLDKNGMQVPKVIE